MNDWLTPKRFLALTVGCLLILVILSIATASIVPLAFGVVAWFCGRLLA